MDLGPGLRMQDTKERLWLPTGTRGRLYCVYGHTSTLIDSGSLWAPVIDRDRPWAPVGTNSHKPTVDARRREPSQNAYDHGRPWAPVGDC